MCNPVLDCGLTEVYQNKNNILSAKENTKMHKNKTSKQINNCCRSLSDWNIACEILNEVWNIQIYVFTGFCAVTQQHVSAKHTSFLYIHTDIQKCRSLRKFRCAMTCYFQPFSMQYKTILQLCIFTYIFTCVNTDMPVSSNCLDFNNNIAVTKLRVHSTFPFSSSKQKCQFIDNIFITDCGLKERKKGSACRKKNCCKRNCACNSASVKSA